MSRSDDRSSNDRSYPRRVESLRKTHEEARTVLDHQIQILDDIDDKATRTVRITALLLGVVVSSTSLVADPYQFINQGTTWGALSLALSIVLGTVTYSVSSPDLGPGPRDIERVRESNYREDEWLMVMLASYEDWIDQTEWISRFNGAFLALAQLSLGVGLLLFVLGVLDSLGASVAFVSISPHSAPVQIIAATGFVGVLVSVLRRAVNVVR
jgi:hypothetical protein